jgi:hypothetical protein
VAIDMLTDDMTDNVKESIKVAVHASETRLPLTSLKITSDSAHNVSAHLGRMLTFFRCASIQQI